MGVTDPICKVPKWLGKEGNFRPSPTEYRPKIPNLQTGVLHSHVCKHGAHTHRAH
jgi:hypothetical protein